MKILITGSKGQLGIELLKQLEKINEKENLHIIKPSRIELNLLNLKKCEEYVKDLSPDILINLAAYTAVDQAENDFESARKINGLVLKSFANALKQNGGHIFQISSDYVFNGKQNTPYKTNQIRDPLGVYGKTKYEGELLLESILSNTNQFTIIRTSWLVSPWRNNFVKTILNILNQEGDHLKIVADQIGCLTTAKNLAKLIILLIEKKRANEILPTHLHWSSSGQSSWYEIALKIREIGTSLNIIDSKKDIIPIKSDEYKSLCPRPKFSLLDTSLTTNLFDIKSNYWVNDLEILLEEIKNI